MNDGVFLAVSIGVLAGLASARLILDLSARHCRMLLDDMLKPYSRALREGGDPEPVDTPDE